METLGDRRRNQSLLRQLHALGPLLLIWAVTAVLLWGSAAQDEVSTERLFLDAGSLGDQPWYAGLLHEMGVLGWTVAATAAAGGAWMASLTGRRASMWFLASGVALTLLLLGDDVTGFHADLGPRLGLAKLTTVAGLLAAAMIWVTANWREVRRTRWLILVAALGALATSVAIDYAGRAADLHVFFEDGPKLLGIVGWATYFALTAVDIMRSVIRSRDTFAAA